MVKVVTDYLENCCKQWPTKIAIYSDKGSISFNQLHIKSLEVGQAIINKEIGINKPVAIFAEKSIKCIASFFGVAYSGNFYTLIDPTFPKQRIDLILSEFQPALIITTKNNYDKIESYGGCDIICIDDCEHIAVNLQSIESIHGQQLPSDVLYVIFTSGSTGIPKGVVTSHEAVIEYMKAWSKAYSVDHNTIIGNQSPLYFVQSITDVYSTFLNGSTLCLIPESYFMFPGKLVKYMEAMKINLITWVPSALDIIKKYNAFKYADLTCLKTIVFGGEVMSVETLNAWRSNLPGATFINGYGSSEITDGCMYYIVNRDFSEGESLPLGVPFENCRTLVLDDDNQEIKERNKVGELCIMGPSLSYGYYNHPELTEKVFIQNPLNTHYKETVYKMGDLVKYNDYGELEFVGRADSQIKHMGRRIELGEIESAMVGLNEIEKACCLYNKKSKKIVAIYEGCIESQDVVVRLREKLPSYMCPGEVVKLDKIPLNGNGKIDRALLKTNYGI